MNPKYFSKSKLRAWMMLFIIIVIVTPLPGIPTIQAQSVHPACLDDGGTPVMPSLVVGAWALSLNFNHSYSSQETYACRSVVASVMPLVIDRTVVTCPLIDNPAGERVGNGTSSFDGNFRIVCPGDSNITDPLTYGAWYMYARAQFPTLLATETFTLVGHEDIAFHAVVGSNNRAALRSRYNTQLFQNFDSVTNVAVAPTGLYSYVAANQGAHINRQQGMNRNVMLFNNGVTPFAFDSGKPIVIGNNGGSPWTLHEMIIDPPPPNSGFDP